MEQNKLSEKKLELQAEGVKGSIDSYRALKILKKGNQNFVDNWLQRRNYRKEVRKTSGGQSPFAAVLSFIDSRVPTETIFDLEIGDAFNARIAGNFINNDILGGLEFAYNSGIKLILVLGHSGCGAVEAAIANCKTQKTIEEEPKCNHIIPMVKNICPAVERTKHKESESKSEYQQKVTKENVKVSIENIRNRSKCLRKAEKKGMIKIVGGIYSISSGKVSFFEHLNCSK